MWLVARFFSQSSIHVRKTVLTALYSLDHSFFMDAKAFFGYCSAFGLAAWTFAALGAGDPCMAELLSLLSIWDFEHKTSDH